MSAKCRSKVLCQNAVPYELYTGLTFTTIWLETRVLKENVVGFAVMGRAFLFRKIDFM